MNTTLTQKQKKTRLLLYIVISLPIIINLILAFFNIGNINNHLIITFEIILSLLVLLIAKIQDLINWKSYSVALTIALALIIIALFR